MQLSLVLDTLQKYETLYRNERAISATLKRVVGIDTGRLLRKDSLQARTDTVCTATERQLASETKRADAAEQVAAEKDKELQKLQPKTWLGRQLGYAKTGLAVLGVIALINWAAH
ncbi:hypothetical protein [Fibrella aestuarina]|uniref:hypothetical protein n=1 Tax=Fibrella aestuarina TaxID=651143 RepID=UPI0002DA92E2|nr:hypothetical protein [Fibrella aestuarina]